MLIFLALLHSLFFSPQQIRIPGPGGQLHSGGGGIGTPVGTSAVGAAGGTSIASNANTTTTGDLLNVYSASNGSCNARTGSSAFIGPISGVISDTGGDTFQTFIPPGGAYLIGMQLTGGGIGYNIGATCTVTGGGATMQATCTAAQTGGVVTSVALTGNGDGTYISAPTISITGTGGSGATAAPTVYGIPGATFCSYPFYAANITGTTNNVVTVTLPGTLTFRTISVSEVSGLAASSPLDTTAAGSASTTSVTSTSATPSNASTIGLCGSEVFNGAAQTWVAGNVAGAAAALVTGSIPNGQSAADNFIATEYKIFSSAPTGTSTISSTSSSQRAIICGFYHQ